MNGRELFEIYALEVSLAADGPKPYWDFLTCSERDLWSRVAKRLSDDNPLAGVEVYEVDGSRYPEPSRYSTEVVDGGPGGLRPITTEDIQAATIKAEDIADAARELPRRPDDYPLGPGRIQRFRNMFRYSR